MLGQGCRCHQEVVTWCRWAGLSLSSRAGDVALVGRFIGVIGWFGVVGGQVTWRHGIVGDGGIDDLTPVWPHIGQSPGCSMAVVLAARSGGGGGGGWWWW